MSNHSAFIRPSSASDLKKTKYKPNVIKGFWSSEASSKPEDDNKQIDENPVELKYDFYNSGIGFYKNDQTPERQDITLEENNLKILKTP